ERAAKYVMRKFNIANVLATRSGDGVTMVTEENKTTHIRTIEQEVFDPAGAGDTILAVFGMTLAGGRAPEDGAYLANLAASIVVSKAGTYAVSQEELVKMLA
ncbi:MAG: D-glycero-beta-D-manno-heptose-7-phosphate kinase, partial [Selenomonadaceae bacterium]|nr:D-glycero-beta-D-manno-heptose-7-phosphate kinase [Selenomonadaceae bacterium]